MDTEFNETQAGGMRLNGETASYMETIAKWTKFMAIVGFVMIGLMVIFSFGVLLFSSSFAFLSSYVGQSSGSSLPGNFILVIYGITYLCFALIYFFPCLWLFQFAAKARKALRSGYEPLLTTAFRSFRNYWLFMGVLTVISLIFIFLAVIFMIIAFAAMPGGIPAMP